MIEEFLWDIRPRLGALPTRHRAVFALACCDTMAPNYHAFTLVEQRGDWELLSSMIEEIWTGVLSDNLSRPHVRELQARINSIFPDEEDDHFGTWLTPKAEDALAALDKTLESYIRSDVSYTIQVARLSINTIDTYLSLVNYHNPLPRIIDGAFSDFIYTCPLILAEFQRQEAALSQLESSSILTTKIIDEIRSVARRGGIQPIQRGLVTNR
jgi:uncharacterized protein YjaG (DUF416 family)